MNVHANYIFMHSSFVIPLTSCMYVDGEILETEDLFLAIRGVYSHKSRDGGGNF